MKRKTDQEIAQFGFGLLQITALAVFCGGVESNAPALIFGGLGAWICFFVIAPRFGEHQFFAG